jgi:hypothetical protein
MGDGTTYSKPKRRIPIWAIGVGVVVCGLCAAALFPLLATRCPNGPDKANIDNLMMIGLGTLMYATDWDDRYPLNMSSAAAVEPCLSPYKVSPSDFVEMNPAGGSYLGDPRLNGLSSVRLSHPEEVVMFFDEKPWADQKVDVVYADAHAKGSLESTVAQQRAAEIEMMKSAPSGSESSPKKPKNQPR